MTPLNQIKKIIREEKPQLMRNFGVSKVGIFGSSVLGDFGKRSDIDILVEFKRPIGLFAFIELENYLSKKLGRKVDLVSRSGLKPYIRNDILRTTVYA